KNRRLWVTLFLAILLAVSATMLSTVTSQGQDPNSQTNQADKVSGTAITVTTCGTEVDCEDGRNPEDNFTFDASDGARPVAAGTPCCTDPACEVTTEPCLPAEEAPAAFDNQT